MAKTPSTMIPLGTVAPDFILYDTVSEKDLSLTELKSSTATVIMFICNHCPFVKHIEDNIASIASAYQKKGVAFIAISANDIETYPQDGPLHMKDLAKQKHFTFPYLYDQDQSTAKAYQAACTPDFFVFDENLKCVYRGRFDASTPGNDIPPTGNDLTSALDAILAHQPVNDAQHPSIGCNIKWRVDF